jgi:glycosyltransferase involved in cell wall biosynthesis
LNEASPPLLLHVFPGFGIGGAQVRFAALANRFGRRWRHLVFAMDGNLACRERLDAGLDVTFPTLALRKGDTLGNLRRCRAALRAWRPDLLVTSNFGAIEWALANAPPLLGPLVRHVHTEDGFGPEERDRQLPRRVRLRRWALRRSQVVVPSRTLQRIATEVWRLDSARVAYVANGIDLARFGQQPRLATGEVAVGTVAGLRPEKNLSRLLRAFALLPPAPRSRLVVVGDGPQLAELQALAASLGVGARVTFAGHMPRPELAYAGFDIFALSSDTEQMPLSVLEAMASGLPVASTDVGDVAAMLSEANRHCVVAPTDAALAGALRALLEDAALRREMGAANRARAERDYQDESMFQTYAALFDGLAKHRHGRA